MSRIAAFLFTGLLFITISCSTTETAAPGVETETASGKYPAWFTEGGFAADSLTYHGFSTAIASDSARALSNARVSAKANLEQHIAEELEEVREQLAENGSQTAGTTDFILVLRNATDRVEENAIITENEVNGEEDHYRAFVQMSISSSKLKELLEAGFEGHPNYWEEFANSQAFAEKLN